MVFISEFRDLKTWKYSYFISAGLTLFYLAQLVAIVWFIMLKAGKKYLANHIEDKIMIVV